MKRISLLFLGFLLMIHPALAESGNNLPESIHSLAVQPISIRFLSDRLNDTGINPDSDAKETAEQSKSSETWIPEKPTVFSFAYDYTQQTLSYDQVTKITQTGRNLSGKTGAQAIVLVVNSFGKTGLGYATEIINKWGIGSKERNDGVVIALAVDDRMVDIRTGSGIDTILTERILNEILDKHIQLFIDGKYGEGLISVYQDVSDFLIFAIQ